MSSAPSAIDALADALNQKLVIADSDNVNASIISQLASKFPELSAAQSAEQHQWLTLSLRFPESLAELNETLKHRTYLLNTPELSLADVVAYTRVREIVKAFKVEEIKGFRHIVRWLDLIQHEDKVEVKKEDIVDVNVDLEAEREIKAKPEKKKAAAADAAAPAAKKDAKKGPKVKADKKAGAEKKDAAPATEGAAVSTGEARAEKKEKKKKEKKPQPAKVEIPITPGMIDLRVGHIQKAIKHPDADSLYVSTIDVGDAEGTPRTICSGLVKYYPLEALQDRLVVVVANLKPVNMRGIKSAGMVLCASEGETVEFVEPPAGSKPGDKLFFEGYDIDPEAVLNPKKKIWETVQPGFTTAADKTVVFRKEGDEERKLVNKKGEVCASKTLVGAAVR